LIRQESKSLPAGLAIWPIAEDRRPFTGRV